MVIFANGAPSTGPASLFPISSAPPTESTNSFAQQLASALAGYLGQAGDSPHFEIDVQVAPGQTSGARQFVVTVRDSATTANPPAPAAPPVTLMSIPRPPGAPGSSVPIAVPPPDEVKRLANGRPVLNSADAYWYTQPPEVQPLQNLNSEEARSNLAHQLADQGFLIDVPIMVWGWDPLATMIVRKNQGFTWVPSAQMEPVQVAPGLAFGGLPSYDAEHPPQGSIRVTTEWAKGLESTDAWLHPGDY